MTDNELPVEFGFGANATTGWGLLGLHMALGLARQGRRVYLPAQATDLTGVPATLLPTLAPMLDAGDVKERRIRIDAYGNHWPVFQPIPNRVRVLFAVFEDSAIPDSAIPELQQYNLILSPSQWVHDLLESKGVISTIWHQGFDESLFHPAPRRRSSGPLYVFSGGKLEFRKGQDIVVEAFRRFRETPEGKDAILVTAWQNKWPQTMHSIWESGYVKGVPTMRGPQLDISGWLEVNGIPHSASIDLGFLSQAELANAIRECDVGLFPNRCEGATNMALVEAMGCGLPCVFSNWTGHADVVDIYKGNHLPVEPYPPVTLPCPLFKGMDGWGEAPIDELVEALCADATVRVDPDLGCHVGRCFGWGFASRILNTMMDLAVEVYA